MKNILVLMLVFESLLLSGQVSCDSFCIKDIRIDTSVNPNLLKYTITFHGNLNNFINYPHISALTNSNLDTIGTGTLSLFGQIGGSAEVYEVSTDLDSIPTDFILHFSFDTSVCLFNNFCNPSTTPISKIAEEDINLFFIHSESIICAKQALSFKEAEIKIFDLNGLQVKKDKILEYFKPYNLADLAPGVYIFQLNIAEKRFLLYFSNNL